MKKRKLIIPICIGAIFVVLACIVLIILISKNALEEKKKESVTVLPEYEVMLPDNYENGDEKYAVIYVLPEDGYTPATGGIAKKLKEAMTQENYANMIFVCPSFSENEDLHASMKQLVQEIDGSYRTIADKEHRTLIGAGTGGYLAYILGLTQNDVKLSDTTPYQTVKEAELFANLVSIRGDFVSDDNPWYDTYGDVYAYILKMYKSDKNVFDGFYTYMDAPVDDAWTNMEGSTNDLGAMFISFGTGSDKHEFTVRAGEFSEEFQTESVNRVMNRLTGKMFPDMLEETSEDAADAALSETTVENKEPVIDGEYQYLDLSGGWYFNYVGKGKGFDAKTLTADEYKTWSVVQPGSHWTKGYGNISDDNVKTGFGGEEYFDYMIIGNGYYVKEFDLPESFNSEKLILSIGYVDDRCEVFMNGERVGGTGIDENGTSNGETSWSEYSKFEVASDLVVRGGTNVVMVRAFNDSPYGVGGWYRGPVALCSETAYLNPGKNDAQQSRFIEKTFPSAYAAKASGEKGTVENEYLIYLPKDYEETERYYPTVYLLHQFNSDHNSYKVDNVDALLDEGMEKGIFDEMIVVVPNSDENSWWKGGWEKMLTEELIPLVDAEYRTIKDARYRLTAGCSMGGQGAFSVALRNPDYFSGAVSFFGAFSYGGQNSPDQLLEKESVEYMDYYTMFFICGNQDSYGFGAPAIQLNQFLTEKGIEHGFFIENGGHDSEFYVPYFDEAFGYVRSNMYQSDEAVENLISGKLRIAAKDGLEVTVELEALKGIEDYYNMIPDSSYTKETNPGLSVPFSVQILQDGEVIHTQTEKNYVITPDKMKDTFTYDFSEYMTDMTKDYSIVFKAAIFDRVVTLDTVNTKESDE